MLVSVVSQVFAAVSGVIPGGQLEREEEALLALPDARPPYLSHSNTLPKTVSFLILAAPPGEPVVWRLGPLAAPGRYWGLSIASDACPLMKRES